MSASNPILEKAFQEVFAICHGKRWQMCIPVQEDSDSDTVIIAGLKIGEEAEALRAELAQARAGLPQASGIPCVNCGGQVVEFTVPSDIWNAVVRLGGPEHDREYLCWNCFWVAVRSFLARAEAQRDGYRQALEKVNSKALSLFDAQAIAWTVLSKNKALEARHE